MRVSVVGVTRVAACSIRRWVAAVRRFVAGVLEAEQRGATGDYRGERREQREAPRR
jgi:hypothetical protein